MSEDLAIYDQKDLSMFREPSEVLAEARKAAIALKEVISKKTNPVIFNKEQYLEFEDWQTVGKFYGITVKVVSTNPVSFGDVIGFEARAVAIHGPTGQEVSAAEAMCLNDEEKWSKRTKYEYVDGKRTATGEVSVPLYQLRSMAQTRACAKAFRNVLAWVVVLAGYRPTPAEEMTGVGEKHKEEIREPQEKESKISEAQSKRFYAIAKGQGYDDPDIKSWLKKTYNIESTRDILRSNYEECCKWAETKRQGQSGEES